MSITIVQLERDLVALGADLDAAAGLADVSVAVLARLRDAPAAERRGHGGRWLGAAAAVVLLMGGAVAVPGARRAVGRWLGFDSVRIEPTPASDLGVQPTFPASLDLPAPVDPSDATRDTGLPVPSLPGHGDGIVTVVTPPDGGQVLVVYPPGPDLPPTPIAGVGALLATVPGRIHGGLFTKTAEPGVTVTNLQLTTATGEVVPAYWIGGAPHVLYYEQAGSVGPLTLRLASNTLLWQVGDVVYRLESALSQARAGALAGTVVVADKPG